MSDDQTMGEEFYSAYAAGTIDPALKLLVETQAALREDVRRQLHMTDAIGGAFLETETPTALSATALAKTLAFLDEETAQTREETHGAIKGSVLDELILLPEPLKEKAMNAARQSGWKFANRGLKRMMLDVDSEASVELLRIEPGCGAPRHTHAGQEYTLVITGSFTDEVGTYRPGDISVAGPDREHRPVADEGEICFALAVTDGGLKFTGWLGVVQKFFG
ncbi:ChrR family anti-sigma-E factor [Ponticaulis profundi]|uniref:ChrR family anti-sigma-E factor n=1 Tax=Ponticaulis profundi TaxID=2665222 RepID=A0ABW1S8Y6_9PROT